MERSIRIFIISFATLPFVASPCWAKTIRVPTDSSSIQAGINGAEDGDSVLVADGVYTGEGNRDIPFLGKEVVVLAENGADYAIIYSEGDAENYHRGFQFTSSETRKSRLEGFTIMSGYAHDGGAITCTDSSSPTIANCIIKDNKAKLSGSALNCHNSSPEILNCIFMGNEAEDGTITCSGDQASPRIANCTISENVADQGGAIFCGSSHECVV
jgi:hypothetical protein